MAVTSPRGNRSNSKSAAAEPERFAGFPDEGIQFLLELQAEQSRTWFKAHQDDYLRLCRRPMELFMLELQTRLGDVYPRIREVEPHIFRIQRDTRFSREKLPYKTNVAAGLALRAPAEGEDRHITPGMHVSFGIDGEFLAIGAWYMPAAVLARYREVLNQPRVGTRLNAIVNSLVSSGWSVASMESLKRVPSPYPQDHPCAELLKRKGLAVSIQPRDGLSASPEYADWAEARLREAAPMVNWLERHLQSVQG